MPAVTVQIVTASSVKVFLKSKFNNFFARWNQAIIVTAIAA